MQGGIETEGQDLLRVFRGEENPWNHRQIQRSSNTFLQRKVPHSARQNWLDGIKVETRLG